MRIGLVPLVIAAAALLAPRAAARPTGPGYFCDEYSDTATCKGKGTTCLVCHTSTSPEAPDWNGYGFSVLLALNGEDFDVGGNVSAALRSVEAEDADGDGLSNLEEIVLGTLPGDPRSFFVPPPPGRGAPNPHFDVGNWDPRFALRRVTNAYCGRSPSFAEARAVTTAADPRAAVHDKLDECLQSTFWTNEGLSRLADEKIRPIDLGTSFNWDYRLWRYVMTGDRDVRDLLLATYHVREPVAGQLEAIGDPVNDGNACTDDAACAFDQACFNGSVCVARDGLQPLVAGERAGMIGSAWFHFINTMFSAMPRTTAAHAMRSYLGLDIARQQGIHPIAGEPLDVDGKGVQQEECAQCHATLDPATYAFAKYRGIEQGGGASSFAPNRPIDLGLWAAGEEPQGILLGEPATTLREWAQVAAASDEFQRHLAAVLFEHAVGRRPGPQDGDFEALWPQWSSIEVAFSAERFLHALIDTNDFGAP